MLLTIRKEASEFRMGMGFGNTEPIPLKSLLIKLNIITVFKELSENFSGMAIKAGDFRFMLINSNHSIGRQNFSICHELYHLYVDKDFTPHHCNSGFFVKTESNEYYADIFASYLLMPDDGINNLIPDSEQAKDKISIETVLKIEHYFSCSRGALLFRLKELGLITSKTYDKFNQRIKVTAKQYGYPVDLYESGNNGLVIGDYGTIAKNLFDGEKISEGHFATLMHSIGIDVFNNEENDNQDRPL